MTEAEGKDEFADLLNQFVNWKGAHPVYGRKDNKEDRNILNMLHHGWAPTATFRYWYVIDRALRSLRRRRGMAMLRADPDDMKAAIEAEMKKEDLKAKDMGDYAPSKVAAALQRMHGAVADLVLSYCAQSYPATPHRGYLVMNESPGRAAATGIGG